MLHKISYGISSLVPLTTKSPNHFVGTQRYESFSFSSFMLLRILFPIIVVALCNQAIAQNKSGQSGNNKKGPFFYGTVVVWPEFSEWYHTGQSEYPGGKREFLIGLHPSDANEAQRAACMKKKQDVDHSNDSVERGGDQVHLAKASKIVTDSLYKQCIDAGSAARCGNGKYFAVASAFHNLGTRVNRLGNTEPISANMVGIACGSPSLKDAQQKAIANCNNVMKKRGYTLVEEHSIFDVRDPPKDRQHNCRIEASGLNNGKYAGRVLDLDKPMAKGEFWDLQLICWGAEREADPFLIKPEWISKYCESRGS